MSNPHRGHPSRLRTSLLREPALHFVVIGAALFALHHLVASDAPPIDDGRTIEIDDELVEALRASHEQRLGRAPSDVELSRAIDRWIDEEVLYREALALGLDRGDPIVRRRLVQKMSFLSEDLVAVEPPDEATLEAWLRAHPDRFRRPEAFTLEHVFVRREGPLHDVERAERLLLELGSGADAEATGDPFVRGRRFVEATRARLDGTFGPGFGDAVAALPVGSWAGPVRSGYGLHLVRISSRREPSDPALAVVADEVRRDWTLAARDDADREALRRLREAYDVRLTASTSASPTIGAAAALEASP